MQQTNLDNPSTDNSYLTDRDETTELILKLQRVNTKLDCALVEVRAEIAALRTYKRHKLSEFPYHSAPVDRYDEPLFAFTIKPRFSSKYLAKLNRGVVPTNKLDIISDDHIYNLHLSAEQHGCTPVDIAKAEKSKALNSLSVSSRCINYCRTCKQYVAMEHDGPKGIACEQYLENLATMSVVKLRAENKERSKQYAKQKAKREKQGKAKQSSCEEAWQLELATWPKFIPRSPINPSQIQVRSVEWINQSPFGWKLDVSEGALLALIAEVGDGDYLTKAFPCQHPNLRTHTFADGSTIKMCPDCTSFTNQRSKVLKDIPKSAIPKYFNHQPLPWEKKLEESNLSLNAGWGPHVSYHPTLKMDSIEHARAAVHRWGGKRVKLNSWQEDFSQPENWKQKIFDKELHHVAENPSRIDRSVRDFRAAESYTAQEAVTQETVNCVGCGIIFVPQHASQIYHDENCKKKHWKQLNKRRKK